MADKFAMDFGASSIQSVRRLNEEETRFQGIAPVSAPEPARAKAEPARAKAEPARAPERLIAEGEGLADALADLIEDDARVNLALAGCERIDTHISREHKKRMRVFCATHGLTMRQVMAVAFEAVVAAMDEYDARGV